MSTEPLFADSQWSKGKATDSNVEMEARKLDQRQTMGVPRKVLGSL